jgi:hypothetical protein
MIDGRATLHAHSAKVPRVSSTIIRMQAAYSAARAPLQPTTCMLDVLKTLASLARQNRP